MIKGYLGNDTYEYILASGKTVTLTGMELEELIGIKDKIDDLKSELQIKDIEIKRLKDIINGN